MSGGGALKSCHLAMMDAIADVRGEDRLTIASSRGQPRLWTSDEKQGIVAESHEEEASVAVVARRHGVNANQLFRRREFRSMRPSGAVDSAGLKFQGISASISLLGHQLAIRSRVCFAQA